MGRLPSEPSLGIPLDFMRTVWAVDHALNGLSRMMESRLGVTGPQRLVLRVVGRVPGISMSALSRMVHLDPSTLTGHLNRLVDAGLVTRRRASDDKRRFELRLTAAGARFDVATPGTIEAAVTALTRSFSATELKHGRRVLARLALELQKQITVIEAGPPSRRKLLGRPG